MNARYFLYHLLAFMLVLIAGSIHFDRLVAAQSELFIVAPASGLQTTESGGQATFTVALGVKPDSAVHVAMYSSDPTEAIVSTEELTLPPGAWPAPETVTITGVADGITDGDKTFSIILSPATSNDPIFDGQDPPDVTVTNLDVVPVNQQPEAHDDSDITSLGVAITTNVLANDLGLGDEPLTVNITQQPANGTAEATPDNQVTYTPNPDFDGQDSYWYEVCDQQGDCDVAGVTVVVQAENGPPLAVDDSYTVAIDTVLEMDVMDNDTDEDGDILYLDSFETASVYGGSIARIDNGTPSDTSDDQLFYLPALGFDDSDTFTYTISDGELTATATVTVQVGVEENAPIANDDSYATGLDTPLVVTSPNGVLANDEDVNGTGLAAIIVSEPASGTLEFNGDGSFTYTPNTGFSGEDLFIYKANDGSSDSNEATVTITVTEINYAPVAVDDSYTVGQLETLVVSSPGLMENDDDANGDELKTYVVSGPEHGSLTLDEDGAFTYAPDGEYVGVDSFIYHVKAGSQQSNEATVDLHVLDQVAPTLAWALPILDGGVYDVGKQAILLKLDASDNVKVESIELFRWDAVEEVFVDIAVLEEAPYEYELDAQTLNLEWNQVFAIAYDAEGNPSERQFIWLYRLDQDLLFIPLVTR